MRKILKTVKLFLIPCILFVMLTACRNDKISGDLSVSAEIIDMGIVDFCSCQVNYYNNLVKIIVHNNSNTEKSFWMMSCSWQESFICDKEDITFCPRECDSNVPIEIKLSPNQKITFNGALKQLESNSQSRVFRIGLILMDEKDYYDLNKKSNPKYKQSQRTYWSNSVPINYKGFGYELSK